MSATDGGEMGEVGEVGEVVPASWARRDVIGSAVIPGRSDDDGPAAAAEAASRERVAPALPLPEPAGDDDPDAKAERLEGEIGEIQTRLGGLVDELDRRRRQLAPGALVRSHPLTVALGGLAVAGVVAGAFALYGARGRRRRSLRGRVEQLRLGLGRVLEPPDRVTRPVERGSAWRRLVFAAASAAATVAARHLAMRLLVTRRST